MRRHQPPPTKFGAPASGQAKPATPRSTAAHHAPPPTRFGPGNGLGNGPEKGLATAPAAGPPGTAQPMMEGLWSMARAAANYVVQHPVGAVVTAGIAALTLSIAQAQRMIATAPAYLRNVPVATVMFGGHNLVRALFHLFRAHYRYDLALHFLGWGGGGNVHTNCNGLSVRFVADLAHFGIQAVGEAVAQGNHFIVQCPNFIDAAVPGNVWHAGARVAGWYVFDTHYAVRYRGLYYDTMAGTIYANFHRDIDLVIVSDTWHVNQRVVFANANGGNVMLNEDRLVMDGTLNEPGSFNRCTLISAGQFYGGILVP